MPRLLVLAVLSTCALAAVGCEEAPFAFDCEETADCILVSLDSGCSECPTRAVSARERTRARALEEAQLAECDVREPCDNVCFRPLCDAGNCTLGPANATEFATGSEECTVPQAD